MKTSAFARFGKIICALLTLGSVSVYAAYLPDPVCFSSCIERDVFGSKTGNINQFLVFDIPVCYYCAFGGCDGVGGNQANCISDVLVDVNVDVYEEGSFWCPPVDRPQEALTYSVYYSSYSVWKTYCDSQLP
jgi:hypothetical protein